MATLVPWAREGGRVALPSKATKNSRPPQPQLMASAGAMVATTHSGRGTSGGAVEVSLVPSSDRGSGGTVLVIPQSHRVSALAVFDGGGEASLRGRQLIAVASKAGIALHVLDNEILSGSAVYNDVSSSRRGQSEPRWLATPREATRGAASEVEVLLFDPTGLLLVAAAGRQVEVLQTACPSPSSPSNADSESWASTTPQPPLLTLPLIPGACCGACFLPSAPHLLATLSADRTLRVSDLTAANRGNAAEAFTQTGVLCAAPLVCLAAHPSLPLLACGSAEGRLWVFEIKGGGNLPPSLLELWTLDLSRSLARLEHDLSSQPPHGEVESHNNDAAAPALTLPEWLRDAPASPLPKPPSRADEEGSHSHSSFSTVEHGAATLALHFSGVGPHVRAGHRGHLFVVCPTALLAVDVSSFDVSLVDAFLRPTNESTNAAMSSPLGPVGSACLVWSAEEGLIRAALKAAFSPINFLSTPSGKCTCWVVLQTYAPVSAAEQRRQLQRELLQPTRATGREEDAGRKGFAADALAEKHLPDTAHAPFLSLFPSPLASPLPPDSALRVALGAPKKSSPPKKPMGTHLMGRGQWERPLVDKDTGKVVDQPITFHSRIKSSGYGCTSMGQHSSSSSSTWAKSSHSRNASSQAKAKAKKQGGGAPMRHAQEYPLQCGPLVMHQPLNDVSIAEAQATAAGAAPPIGPPIVALAYHGSASQLAVATMDHVVKTVRLPVSKYIRSSAGITEPLGEAFVGHTGRLHSVCYSHDGGLLLTASADRSARMWRIGGQSSGGASSLTSDQKPEVLCFSHKRGHGGRAGDPINEGEVRSAKFFYLDRFVLLACSGALRMYAYSLDDRAPNSTSSLHDSKVDSTSTGLGLQKPPGRYKLAQEWCGADLGSCVTVTAFSCCNAVLSPLVVCAGSNRSVQLLDAATGKVSRTLQEAHATKAVHAVTLPSPSASVALDSAHYDVFATSATDGVVGPRVVYCFYCGM